MIADKFMEAIEVITATVKSVEVPDKNGNIVRYEVAVWNPTVANLSLMALGSSAPEILLAVSEVCAKLGEPAGELGPSTIVGSAAFNLLFISAVCIPAVEAPTKIDDLGVFIVTSIFSLFAYIWMFLCL
jgi:solute carrier family 8 (sodium/calcium exchanger)